MVQLLEVINEVTEEIPEEEEELEGAGLVDLTEETVAEYPEHSQLLAQSY